MKCYEKPWNESMVIYHRQVSTIPDEKSMDFHGDILTHRKQCQMDREIRGKG
jgi:hypothetical protein